MDGAPVLVNGAQNAWDILHEEESMTRITTSCADLDNILGGGISCKEVTEIDTEGSFMVERVLQIAEACTEDMSDYRRFLGKDVQARQVEMGPKDFLENIYYFRACSYTEQIALINYLDKFISEHHNVKMVIIDSVTFHFRQDFDDLAMRTRVLSGMALKLMKLAKKFNLAVWK
ncbi:DNA repair protein RAD51 homolog 3 [Linum perenne]